VSVHCRRLARMETGSERAKWPRGQRRTTVPGVAELPTQLSLTPRSQRTRVLPLEPPRRTRALVRRRTTALSRNAPHRCELACASRPLTPTHRGGSHLAELLNGADEHIPARQALQLSFTPRHRRGRWSCARVHVPWIRAGGRTAPCRTPAPARWARSPGAHCLCCPSCCAPGSGCAAVPGRPGNGDGDSRPRRSDHAPFAASSERTDTALVTFTSTSRAHVPLRDAGRVYQTVV
jgi:hypothetical protein